MDNIKENNKIIAEFLGWKIKNVGKGDFYDLDNLMKSNILNYEVYYIELENQGCIFEIDLCFHNDWNWLILILQRINECVEDFDLPDDSNLIGDISIALLNLDIEELYLSVVEFINYYNKQNNS